MELENNKVSVIIFIVIVVGLLIAGFYFLKKDKVQEETNTSSTSEEIVIEDIKKDKNKDFIYFDNIENINTELEINYMNPVINLDSSDAITITNKLKANVDAIRNSVIYCELEEEKELCEEEIKSAKLEIYEIYKYKNLVTLVVYNRTYSCFEESGPQIPSSYTFDIKTGKLLTYNEILALYNLKEIDITSKIKENLKSSQESIAAEDSSLADLIKVTDTMNSLEYNKTYTTIINNFGDLIINYIVKTSEVNYNETITIIEN